MLLVVASSTLYALSTENLVSKPPSLDRKTYDNSPPDPSLRQPCAAPLGSSPMFTIDTHPPNLIVQIGEAKPQSHAGGARSLPLAQLSPPTNRLPFVVPRNASRVQTFKWHLHIGDSDFWQDSSLVYVWEGSLVWVAFRPPAAGKVRPILRTETSLVATGDASGRLTAAIRRTWNPQV